jgi:hypothetical protein
MKSTKIKIAIVLGLTSAVVLGLVLMSSPVEAENVPLKMYFEDTTFSPNTVQFLEGTLVKQNYAGFPSTRTYTRTSGNNYYLRIAGGADCKFVTDNYLNEKYIPEEVPEIYLTFENNACVIDTKSLTPAEPLPGESKLDLQVFTKNMSGLVMDLVFSEFDNTGTLINTTDNTEKISGDYWQTPLSLSREMSYVAGQGYAQMTVKGNGYAIDCSFDNADKIQKVTLSKVNMLIDLDKRTCTVSNPELKIVDQTKWDYSALNVTFLNGYSSPDYYYESVRIDPTGEYSLIKEGWADRFSISIASPNGENWDSLDYCFIGGVESQKNLEIPTYASDITLTSNNGICVATINNQ